MPSEKTSTLSPEKNPREVYTTPVLVEYGDITELTKNVGMVGAADGGVGNDKTR